MNQAVSGATVSPAEQASPARSGQLTGKLAVVVGGSVAIGKAIARRFADEGAVVAIVSRDQKRGQAAADELRAAGGTAHWFGGDFLDYASIRKAAEAVEKQLGGANILVVSGGPENPRPRLFMDAPPEDYIPLFQNKCLGRLTALRAFADQMIAKGKGKVVFITTDAGRVPTPSEALIGSAAAALMYATRSIGKELSRHGIRVNCVSATLTKDTNAWDRFTEAAARDSDAVIVRAFKKVEARSPFGLNEPADVANAALFFASDASDQISGATISVNGGLSFP